MNQTFEQQHAPLPSHRYPFLIYIFCVVILISICYSLYDLPIYLKAGKFFHVAKSEYENNQFEKAIEDFKQALKFVPTSKVIKINIAKAYFKEGGDRNETIALNYLDDITLSKNEYDDIRQIMPDKYQELFVTTKRS